jgi:hypothetical protein
VNKGLNKALKEIVWVERALFILAVAFIVGVVYKFGFSSPKLMKVTYLDQLRAGTFRVQVGESGRATAAYIGNNFALSAGHVCDQEVTSAMKVVDFKERVYSIDGYHSSLEQERDLCVLHIVEPVENLFTFTLPEKETVTISKYVYLPGWAGGRFYSVRYGMVNGEYTLPISMDPFGLFLALFKVQMVDIPMEPGGSGGAALQEDGKLVGIVSATDGKTTLIVPLNTIHSFLDDARRIFPNLP